ncbi:hypothetical protein [Pikeienuella piscinae]|uniref:hypothetical protein n=1 Tax=Pikeienuella piscinae TaxID=2748098 RepID=UPI0013EB3245|nr:hypothetical protein [Pikeienuella piscinae]
MIGREDHELHQRRRGRNLALGAVLIAFAAIIFGVTIAKLGANVIKPEMSWSETE